MSYTEEIVEIDWAGLEGGVDIPTATQTWIVGWLKRKHSELVVKELVQENGQNITSLTIQTGKKAAPYQVNFYTPEDRSDYYYRIARLVGEKVKGSSTSDSVLPEEPQLYGKI